MNTVVAQVNNRGINGFGTTSSSSTGSIPSNIGTNPSAVDPTASFGTPDALNLPVFSGNGAIPIGGNDMSLLELIQLALVYAFIAAAALSAIFIFVGGINFILSGGNDEKIKQAVNTIRYSIIGLIITILSFTFVTIIGRIFGLNFLDYISYDQIRTSINRLVQSNNNGGDFGSGNGTFNP